MSAAGRTDGVGGPAGADGADSAERDELVRRAARDPLTGLANRAELQRALSEHLGRSGAAAVLYLDLDGFKQVNDSLGHAAGDELLVAVAGRLRQQVRTGDVVARLGGDEFVVALLDDDSAASERVGQDVAERVLAALRAPVAARGRSVRVTASIGVAVARVGAGRGGGDGGDRRLLADADAALYQRKALGRDGVTWFDDALREAVSSHHRLEAELRGAARGGQLSLAYQPLLDLREGRVHDVEALLRWDHPERGRLHAGVAVAVAERSGLIADVGAWVITSAVQDASLRWGGLEPFTTWVNASALQLVEQGFTDGLLHQLARAGLVPWRFGVEVTEEALGAGDRVVDELVRLSASGVRVAVDDFGAGQSSLAQLSRFPVDVLKLDASFTAATRTPRGREVLGSLVALGHAIGAQVVGKGVETAAHLCAVRAAGGDAAQGHLLARPGPAGGALGRVLSGRLAGGLAAGRSGGVSRPAAGG